MGTEGEWKLALHANLSVLRYLSSQIKAVEKAVLARVITSIQGPVPQGQRRFLLRSSLGRHVVIRF